MFLTFKLLEVKLSCTNTILVVIMVLPILFCHIFEVIGEMSLRLYSLSCRLNVHMLVVVEVILQGLGIFPIPVSICIYTRDY